MTLTLPPEINLQESTQAFLNTGPKKLLINNEWVDAANGETFATVNPATGEELAQVALAGLEDVDRAVRAAREAFDSGPWASMTGEARGHLLWKLADLIDEHADEL